MSDSQTTTPAPASKAVSVTSEKRWVLASNNKGKLAEFQRLFDQAHLGIEIILQGQLNIEDAIEDGLSFVENAIIKARHASRISGLPAVADDSGLCVPTLGNAPGIYSARYAGEHGNDAKNNAKLIADLQPYRGTDFDSANTESAIKGYFVCVLALVRHADDPLPIIAQGLWQGEILAESQGENGFGYDPLFWVPEYQQTAATMTPEQKNKISHRGLALQSLLKQLTSA